MPATEWRVVAECPAYEVSDDGRVRRAQHGCELRPCDNGKGYLHCDLWTSGAKKRRYVHRLVACAFLPESTSIRPYVNHINGVKGDNRASNLEWCTHRENHEHRTRVLGKGVGEGAGGVKLTGDEARTIRSSSASLSQLSRRFSISPSHASRIKRGTRWQHLDRNTGEDGVGAAPEGNDHVQI